MTKLAFDYAQDYWEPLRPSPDMRDFRELWRSIDQCALRKAENDWYENYARFPGDLCPEYRLWWWRGPAHWWFRSRYGVWQWVARYSYKRRRYANRARWEWLEEFTRDWLLGWNKWETPEWNYCLECGFRYDFTAVSESDWFHFERGGKQFTGEYTQHWFEGLWTCPRCLRQWEYGDSD